MEAPEKIYLIRNISTPTSLNTTNDCREKYLQEWYKGREKDADIEYTRTDAFIEKACEFIKDHHHEFSFWNTEEYELGFSTQKFINDFKEYMKGE